MVSTELAPRLQQFHVAPVMPALKYTTLVDIQKHVMKSERSESAQKSRE